MTQYLGTNSSATGYRNSNVFMEPREEEPSREVATRSPVIEGCVISRQYRYLFSRIAADRYLSDVTNSGDITCPVRSSLILWNRVGVKARGSLAHLNRFQMDKRTCRCCLVSTYSHVLLTPLKTDTDLPTILSYDFLCFRTQICRKCSFELIDRIVS